MLKLVVGRKKFPRCKIAPCLTSVYQYHTYPDPTDGGLITESLSKKTKFGNGKKDIKLKDTFKTAPVFPGIVVSSNENALSAPPTLTTLLPNGLTAGSQDSRGLMTSIIVLVKSGSADEIQTPSSPLINSGVTQLQELTAFRGTQKLASLDIAAKIEKMGAMVQCISSRENIIYCIDTLRVNAEEAIEIIADSVVSPVILEEDILEAQAVIEMQRESLPADLASRDSLNIAAYQNSPFGQHHFCPPDRIEHLNRDMLQKFMAENIVASNIIVAGTGIEHSLFVDIVADKFKAITGNKLKQPRRKSVYTGGMHIVDRQLKEPFSKIAIGFEYANGWNDPRLITGIVMQSLLGGGSSFSAGGPGKGMYTRLYKDVLNRNNWVESCESLLSIYEDSATIAIDIACPEDAIVGGIQVIANEFWKLSTNPISSEELNRAKNMAKSSMLMQLESRLVSCEDIARQLSVFGHRKNVLDTCKQIDAVQAEDILNLAKSLLKSNPSVAATGVNVSSFTPSFDLIQNFFKSKSV